MIRSLLSACDLGHVSGPLESLPPPCSPPRAMMRRTASLKTSLSRTPGLIVSFMAWNPASQIAADIRRHSISSAVLIDRALASGAPPPASTS